MQRLIFVVGELLQRRDPFLDWKPGHRIVEAAEAHLREIADRAHRAGRHHGESSLLEAPRDVLFKPSGALARIRARIVNRDGHDTDGLDRGDELRAWNLEQRSSPDR